MIQIKAGQVHFYSGKLNLGSLIQMDKSRWILKLYTAKGYFTPIVVYTYCRYFMKKRITLPAIHFEHLHQTFVNLIFQW